MKVSAAYLQAIENAYKKTFLPEMRWAKCMTCWRARVTHVTHVTRSASSPSPQGRAHLLQRALSVMF